MKLYIPEKYLDFKIELKESSTSLIFGLMLNQFTKETRLEEQIKIQNCQNYNFLSPLMVTSRRLTKFIQLKLSLQSLVVFTIHVLQLHIME